MIAEEISPYIKTKIVLYDKNMPKFNRYVSTNHIPTSTQRLPLHNYGFLSFLSAHQQRQ